MATHNIFQGGEGGVDTAFGQNAWAIYPRPDISPTAEYKGPGQYSGAVSLRVSGKTNKYASDGGASPLVRYLKTANVADGDDLAAIIVPAHWRLNSVTFQVYLADEASGVYEGGAAAAASGQTGTYSVFLVDSVAATTTPVITGAQGAALPLNATSYANVDVNTVATNNRVLVIRLPTAPTDWSKANFEITAMMEKVRDIGRLA